MHVQTKINIPKAALAGIVGTVVFDVLGFVLTSKFWDVPALLGSKLGAGLAVGVALHYALGVVLAVLYTALAPSLPGGRFGRPLLFMTVQTILGVWLFMMPLVGAGPLGLALGPLVPVITMLRHWAYAGVLGWLAPVENRQEVTPAIA